MKRLRIILGFLLLGLLTLTVKATSHYPMDDPRFRTSSYPREEPPFNIAIVDRNFLVPTLLIIVPIALYRHMRKRFRSRHSLCMKCGYDLRGTDHEACPECGEEIRKGNPS